MTCWMLSTQGLGTGQHSWPRRRLLQKYTTPLGWSPGPSQGIASCIPSVSTHFPALARCPRTWLIKDIQCRPIIFDFEGHKSRLTNKMKTAKYNFMCDSDWTQAGPDGLGQSHQTALDLCAQCLCFPSSHKLLHRFIA